MDTNKRIRSPEYVCWCGILARCYSPQAKGYNRYGGRGIEVCDRWRHSFSNFLEDMGEKPGPEYSIDRIDVDGHYEPSNCRWVTAEIQNNNRSTNRYITFQGKTQTFAQWSRETGIERSTIRQRFNKGMSPEECLTPPARTLTELDSFAETHGVSHYTVYRRIKKGMTLDEALNVPVKRATTFEYKGKALTVSEWAEELGMSRLLLSDRLHRRGWDVERALTTPPDPRYTGKPKAE